MKKTLLSLCTILLVTFVQAQEHMTFKDISLNCDITTFVAKLKAKGYTTTMEFENGAVLSGSFAGKDDCAIIILCTAKSKLVWKVCVGFPEKVSWRSLKSEYNSLKESYIQKYGEPKSFEYFSEPYYEGDGYELQAIRLDKCTYASFFNTSSGLIYLKIDNNCVTVSYEDSINVKIKKDEAAKVVSSDI